LLGGGEGKGMGKGKKLSKKKQAVQARMTPQQKQVRYEPVTIFLNKGR
jgi:hypothetical protein